MHRRRKRRLSVGSNLNQSANHGQGTPSKDSRETSASLNASFADLGTNDDNEERRDLRKSARRSRRKSFVDMVTPKGRTARRRGSSRSRRRSASPGSALKRRTYTNDQLSAIYRDCILKAQTGKINQQNAWNLHLVDNIEQITSMGAINSAVVQEEASSSKQNEFAKASHTIDAASKIYGYRVDSVHNKMYTVLNSIHQQGQGGGGPEGDDVAAEQSRKRKARNRSMGKSTLCEPDKVFKINESVKNLCVEVDPLFHKTASCFDEGGAKGLLMNTLYVQNGVDIVFDSSTKIEQNTLTALDTADDDAKDESALADESAWMSQLCTESFGGKLMESSVDSTNFSQPMEMQCTQADPQQFTVDLDWVDGTAMCPLLEVFQNHINRLNGKGWKALPGSGAGANHSRQGASQVQVKSQDMAHDGSPEKQLNQSGMVALDDGGMDFGGDDDVLMDMPDFTLGGDVSMNAQDLFHEELLTQDVHQQAAQPMQQDVVRLDRSMGALGMNMQLADVDPNNLSSAALDASYVVGHRNEQIRVGNMGVQPLMNSSWIRDDAVVLEKLKQEQQVMPGLHRQGIYKKGAMNLGAMNDVISKLEKADFESLTSFFDTKKHGNWAGPDQWYHRRYQLTLQATQSQRKQRHASASASPSAAGKEAKAKRARKKESSKFDFMAIAGGAFVDEAQFEAPARSYNTLTQASLDKSRSNFHTLPKDLQIKPDMFIKLFHRPNYSVWKHWLNQHKLRMLKRNEDRQAQLNQSAELGVGADGHAHASFADEMGLGDADMDHSMIAGGMHMDAGGQSALMAQNAAHEQQVVVLEQNIEAMENMAQFAAMADNAGDDEDEFQYNYQNPLDASHFVPVCNDIFGGEAEGREETPFDFNLNGYDLIDDPNRKVNKIRVEYAVSAKKVNVRKLKLKLWDRIDADLKVDKENDQRKANTDDEDDDVDMAAGAGGSKGKEKVTFQDSLDSLPANISSAISIHMCFICLLHLANEKELQFVPKKIKQAPGEEVDDSGMMPVRGDFEIQYADAQSAMEMDATKINPVMVLGMQ